MADGCPLTLGTEDGLLLTVRMIDVVGEGIGVGDQATGAAKSTRTMHNNNGSSKSLKGQHAALTHTSPYRNLEYPG